MKPQITTGKRRCDKPMVCVIIPTMQRCRFLEETLSYLAQTSFPHDRLEVFVVDGGSTDSSAEIVRRLQQSSDITFRWYSDKALRVSAARNYAIRNTEAEYLVFLDDDCITSPEWASILIQPLLDNEADIAGGTDTAPEDDPFLAKCEDIAFKSLIGSGGVRGSAGISITDFCPMTCNMAMKRDKMLEVGGFDETMKAVEDTDFVYKAATAGVKVIFVPRATVKHRRRASIRSICFHNYIRGYGRTFLWQRYKQMPQCVFFLPTAGLVGAMILFAVGFIMSWVWLVLLIGILIYSLMLAFSGVHAYKRVGKLSAVLVVPFLVALHHFWYAIGTVHGPLTGYRKIFSSNQARIADPFGDREK